MDLDRPLRPALQSRFVKLCTTAVRSGGYASEPSAPPGTLADVESRLGVAFPDSFKEFLREYGEVAVVDCGDLHPYIDVITGPRVLLRMNRQPWLTILPGHITGRLDDAEGDVFEYLVAFAMDGGGNYVGFPRCRIPNDDLPVLFFDHDLGGLHQVAPSFDEFLWRYVRRVETKARGEEDRQDADVIPPFDQLAFTAENDHNPDYLERCDRCNGFGKLFVVKRDQPRQLDDDLPCPDCGAAGWIKRRWFNNDHPPVEAHVGKDGWVTCPACRWRFAPYDKKAWTGYRHKECGQRLVLRSP